MFTDYKLNVLSVCFKGLKEFIFRAVLISQQYGVESTEFLDRNSQSPSHIINNPHLNGTLLTIEETTLAHYYHQKSMAFIRINSA
jgi:hypothetical protein